MGTWGVKKIQPLPANWDAMGRGTWSVSTQEESEDQKWFGEARTLRDGGKTEIRGRKRILSRFRVQAGGA